MLTHVSRIRATRGYLLNVVVLLAMTAPAGFAYTIENRCPSANQTSARCLTTFSNMNTALFTAKDFDLATPVTIEALANLDIGKAQARAALPDNVPFVSVMLIGLAFSTVGFLKLPGKWRMKSSAAMLFAATLFIVADLRAAPVVAAPAPIALACPVNNGTMGVLYASSLTGSGGVPPYTYFITKGALPGGLTLTAGTGAISGTPNAAGTFTFTAKIVDSLVAGAGGEPNSISTPCTITIDNCAGYTITGPADVPGLSQYTYQLNVPGGKNAAAINWTVDKPTAAVSGAANQDKVTIAFQNTRPDWVSVKASFTVEGAKACAALPVALVMVTVGPATFDNPGKSDGSAAGTSPFLVNPPAAPAKPMWVTTFTPGSSWTKFKYNGTPQAAEPRRIVNSTTAGSGKSAFTVQSKVTLTSPPEKVAATAKIQVGIMQSSILSGNATYGGTLVRNVVIPTEATIDWLSKVSGPAATDMWPWYDKSVTSAGDGTAAWSKTFSTNDSPKKTMPAEYNPNDAADANKNKPIVNGTETGRFTIQIGAQTLDAESEANTHYFSEAASNWTVNYAWPVAAPNVSIVTLGPAWKAPASPTEIGVDGVPSIINATNPFLRWNPSTCPAAVCP